MPFTVDSAVMQTERSVVEDVLAASSTSAQRKEGIPGVDNNAQSRHETLGLGAATPLPPPPPVQVR